jgi:hypothetical protein
MTQPAYKLSDELIAQVAKLVQLALLTGTNVVDHLRLVRVLGTENERSEQVVVLTDEYKDYFEKSINQMLAEVEDIKEEMQNTPAQA